jgi:hypothetical protein
MAHQSTRFYRASSSANNCNHYMLSQTGRQRQHGGGHKTEGPPTHVRPRLYYAHFTLHLADLIALALEHT